MFAEKTRGNALLTAGTGCMYLENHREKKPQQSSLPIVHRSSQQGNVSFLLVSKLTHEVPHFPGPFAP